jgi:hydroxylamine reductase (hybrid-cluster protein)
MKKALIIPVLLAVVVGLAALSNIFVSETVVKVEREQVATTTEESVEADVIDAAKLELERINKELDLEETRLLEERDAIDARLERIRETRTSFQ